MDSTFDPSAHDARPPRIELSADAVAFRARLGAPSEPPSHTVIVRNGGGGVMHLGMIPRIAYGDGEPGAWLSHSYLESGITRDAVGARLIIWASTAHLPIGEYAARVTLISSNAENGPAVVTVTAAIVAG